jgi:thiamine-phosphate pyrophosphorylase
VKRVDLSLYVLVDPARAGGRSVAEIAAAAVRGGASLIQLRDKGSETHALVESALAVRRALAGTHVPLLVNDRVGVAMAANADGVHLGRDDLDLRTARRLLGPRAIIGASSRSEADIDALALGAIDYVCIGGVFATVSKDNPDPPIGIEGFRALAQRVRERAPALPVGAIAGIDASNAEDVVLAGADGVAVISAVVAAADPEQAALELRSIVDKGKLERGGNW